MSKTKFLEMDDVVLRPIEKEDAHFMQETVLEREVRNSIGRAPKPTSIDEQKDWIEKNRQDSDVVQFLIEYQGEKAGNMSLHGLESDYRRGEFGISIHPEFQGKGIGTKSVKMITKYAFETLNFHKLKGGYLEHNHASKKVMEKAGFKEEGIGREFRYVDGEWKDVHWMSILEGEYFGEK